MKYEWFCIKLQSSDILIIDVRFTYVIKISSAHLISVLYEHEKPGIFTHHFVLCIELGENVCFCEISSEQAWFYDHTTRISS